MALILLTRTCVIFVFLTVIQGCSLCLDLLCEVNPGILKTRALYRTLFTCGSMHPDFISVSVVNNLFISGLSEQ